MHIKGAALTFVPYLKETVVKMNFYFIDVDIVALVWVTIYGICNIFFWKRGERFVAGDEFICQVEYSWNK